MLYATARGGDGGAGSEDGIKGALLGEEKGDVGWTELPFKYELAVVRVPGVTDFLFHAAIVIAILASNVGMGCKVDLRVVRQILKRPLAPSIGLFSQFVFMPLVCTHFSFT